MAVYDIIDNGKDGIITPIPYSRDSTVENIKKLMDDDILRDNMAKAATKTAEKYTIREMTNKWYTIFNS